MADLPATPQGAFTRRGRGEGPARKAGRLRPFEGERFRAPARSLADWVALALLLGASCFIFFWNLTSSGYANEFYSAAAQAGSESWSAFLWGASDAGGAITVDKPPASIWLMALSIRLLGLSSFAILLPQAVMGVACTWLVYGITRRYWGNWAGIAAGAVFATTPVAALMFRFNNPDALLVLLMLGASACVLRALELGCGRGDGRRRTGRFALAGALIGLGFLTKQLQVLLVLPGFAVAMLLLSPSRVGRRVADAAAALASMVVAAGWWVALTVVVPSGSRPYIGGSQTDSFLELTFGYNGLGRLTGDEAGSVLPGGAAGCAAQGGMWGETGIGRLLGSDFAGQVTWLAVIAAAGIALGIAAARLLAKREREPLAGVPGTGLATGVAAPDTAVLPRMRLAAIAIFSCWLVVTWLVFSFMAGIFHAYYTVALSPAIAVLTGVFAASMRELADRGWAWAVASVAVAASGMWAFAIILPSGALTWLAVAVLAVSLAASILLALMALGFCGGLLRGGGRLTAGTAVAVALAAVALAAGPVTWTAYTVSTGHTGSIVSAGPSGGNGGAPGGMGGGQGGDGGDADGAPSMGEAPGGMGGGLLGGGSSNTEVAELLRQNASAYRWAAATTGSQNAAGYQLASELPVMAIGGFNGSDPAPTLEQFKAYVDQGLVRYYIAGGGMGGAQMGGSSAASEIEQWVEENFEAQSVGGATVYDLQAPQEG